MAEIYRFASVFSGFAWYLKISLFFGSFQKRIDIVCFSSLITTKAKLVSSQRQNPTLGKVQLRAAIFDSAETVHLILLCCLGDAIRFSVSAALKMAACNRPLTLVPSIVQFIWQLRKHCRNWRFFKSFYLCRVIFAGIVWGASGFLIQIGHDFLRGGRPTEAVIGPTDAMAYVEAGARKPFAAV